MSTLKVNNVQDLGADAVVTNGVIVPSALPAGSILQVVSTTKTDTYSASVTSGGFSGDITGLTASITPRSTSSKIFVLVSLNIDTNKVGGAALYRDGTKIGAGASAGSRGLVNVGGLPGLSNITNYDQPISHLDSPSTTSTITYSVRLWSKESTTQTLYVNRSATDTDSALFGRYSSTITLLEVAG